MSLLASLFQPVVRRFSANQTPDRQASDRLQACDSAHAGTASDGRAPAHHGGVTSSGESVTSRPVRDHPGPDFVQSGSRAGPREVHTTAGHQVTVPSAGSGALDITSAPAGQSSDAVTGGEYIVDGTPVLNAARPDPTSNGDALSADAATSNLLRPSPISIAMPRHNRAARGPAQGGSLPADDGMASLRSKIHEIRDMAASSEEKARQLHALMTESYAAHLPHLARAPSPASLASGERPFTPNSTHSPGDQSGAQSPRSPASSAASVDPANPYNLREEDKVPVYRPSRSRRPSIDYEIYTPGLDEIPEPSEPQLGCKHYKRNVKIQCYDCRRWYPCRHCHDEAELSHALARRKTENMFCMACQTPQAAGECCQKCGLRAAWYYCDICKLWDDDINKRIYHCVDCGICRRGEGIGKDFVHCKRCNICIAIGAAATHRCIERAAECDCPICGDYMFTSSASIVAMPCGHYLHKSCYTRYMETAYKCPICKKSAVNMELQWRKLEHAIESQPMPREFRDTRMVIQCNDCSAKSSVRYHWLGNQCSTCDSFNTNELQLVGPGSAEAQRNTADHRRQRIEPRPPPMLRDEEQVERRGNDNDNNNDNNNNDHDHGGARPRPPIARGHTLAGPLPTAGPGGAGTAHHRLSGPGSYFLSVQDSTSDTSVRRTSIAQNIPFSPLEMFHRVSRSLSPIRHYLIADPDDADRVLGGGLGVGVGGIGGDGGLDDVDFWGTDGGRFLSGEEDDSDDDDDDDDEYDDEYDDSDDSDGLAGSGSEDGEDGEEDEDGRMARRLDGHGHGHAHGGRRELDDLDGLIGHR